jgi:hypothetical protein
MGASAFLKNVFSFASNSEERVLVVYAMIFFKAGSVNLDYT